MRRIIIDCDPGHDDAIAILLALAHPDKFKIEGITTVGGNHNVDKITDNLLKLLTLVDKDIKVAKGAKSPLVCPLVTGEEAHGGTGMDGHNLSDIKFKPIAKGAVEFMKDIITEASDKITLVAIGPLTNIAMLFSTFPEVKEKIELISLMGGGINEGNKTAAAEFNIYVDPEAAKIVFDSGVPIVMSGLDVTNKAQMYYTEFKRLKGKGKVSAFVNDLLDFYSIFSKKFGYDKGSALHDPCAIAYLLNPDIFTAKKYHIDIETTGTVTRGMTVADRRKLPEGRLNANVLLDLDREAFVNMIFNALDILDTECNS